MALIRWQPFRDLKHWEPFGEVDTLRKEMDTLLERFVPEFGRSLDGAVFVPSAEIDETDTEFHLRLEVPGMSSDDLDIEVTDDAVSITGERKSETKSDVASGAIGSGQVLLIAGVTLVSIMTHAFWYTWLINRTGSVLLCIILHASYNAANGLLLLVPDEALYGSSYQALLILMTLVLITSVAGLIAMTRGRLGARQRT